MIWLRKGFVHLLSIVLFASLLGGVVALNLNHVVGDPGKVKTLVAESGIYDHLASATLDQAQKDAESGDGNDSSVSLTDPVVQQKAQQTFTPELLRKSVEQFIDSNYAWLKGQTPKPTFKINLADTKATFAEQVGAEVTSRLSKLPVCNAKQMAELQLPVNPLKTICRPTNMNPQTEGQRVTEDLKNSNDFLEQPVITADTANQGAKGKPYYRGSLNLPQKFQLLQKAPFILAAIALLIAFAIVRIAPSRRRGWRRVGVVLTEAGIILIALQVVSNFMVNNLSDELQKSSSTFLKTQTDKFAHHLGSQLLQFNLLFGVLFLILAVVIFVQLYRTREGVTKTKPAAPAESDGLTTAENEPIPAMDMDVTPPTPQPQPKPTSAPPLKKASEAPKIKSKKPKRPLIQG